MLNPQALALAYALSTVAGLRSSLTVLALSIAVHQHVIVVPAALAWLASDVTVIVAAVFALADFAADKVPVVDHGLHLAHTVLAPFAGGVAGFALLPDITGPHDAASALAAGGPAIVLAVAGGAIAFVVNALRGAIRVAVSALSLGVLNPAVSIIEDVCTVAALIVAFIAPFVAAAIALAITLGALIVGTRMIRAAAARRRTAAVGAGPPP